MTNVEQGLVRMMRFKPRECAETGCEHDDRKETIAIVSTNHASQVEDAVRTAKSVLQYAPELHNDAKLVLIACHMGEVSERSVNLATAIKGATISGIPNLQKVVLVHGALPILRFANFKEGELCKVPDDDLLLDPERPTLMRYVLECLRRPPPIQGKQFPSTEKWEDYFEFLGVLDEIDVGAFGGEAGMVVSLLMFMKALQMSEFKTDVLRFVKKSTVQWRGDEFLEICGIFVDSTSLSDIGKDLAADAREYLDALFRDVDVVLSLLQKSKMAVRFSDEELLIASGEDVVARVPARMTAEDGVFSPEFQRVGRKDDWLALTNDNFHEMIETIRADEPKNSSRAMRSVVHLIGFYSFLKDDSVRVLEGDDIVNDDVDSTLITADEACALSQVNCERMILDDEIEHVECSSVVRVQEGMSFGVSFISFCPSLGGWMFGDKRQDKSPFSKTMMMPLVEANEILQEIASQLSIIAEVANMVGRLSGIVDLEGEPSRLATFKRTNSDRDEVMVLFPESIVDAYFFDYLRGGYAEDESTETGVQIPVFASNSVLTVSSRAMLSPRVGLILPPKLSALKAENITSWNGIKGGETNFVGGSLSVAVFEQQSDGLVGLGIKLGVSQGVYTLVSAHQKETVV